MAKAKAKTTEAALDTENMRDDVAVLLGLKDAKQAPTTGNTSAIKRLIINTDDVDNEGNEVEAKTFHILGTDEYTKRVTFRPLDFYNRLLRQRQKADGSWEVVNETIFFKREQPIDMTGGVGCGRIISGPMLKEMNDTDRELNKKKANWYGHLFGFVSFDKQKPVLVEWRIPGGKAMQISKALNELEKSHGKMSKYYLELTLKPKKGSNHPDLEIVPNVSKELPVDKELMEAATLVLDFVNSKNSYVAQKHKEAILSKSAKVADKELLKDLKGLPDDDEIPF